MTPPTDPATGDAQCPARGVVKGHGRYEDYPVCCDRTTGHAGAHYDEFDLHYWRAQL